MEDLNIKQDFWIKDINSNDIYNLKGCDYVYSWHREKESDYGEINRVTFYYGKAYHELHFETEDMMNNFLLHLRMMVKVTEIDSTKPPIKFE